MSVLATSCRALFSSRLTAEINTVGRGAIYKGGNQIGCQTASLENACLALPNVNYLLVELVGANANTVADAIDLTQRTRDRAERNSNDEPALSGDSKVGNNLRAPTRTVSWECATSKASVT